jgi:hypothetical protein
MDSRKQVDDWIKPLTKYKTYFVTVKEFRVEMIKGEETECNKRKDVGYRMINVRKKRKKCGHMKVQ